MTTVTSPQIDYRAEKPYVGIRTQTPMKGMFKVIDKLFKEMNVWLKKQGVKSAGPPFLRYHVIDMAGEMDIEVGMPVAAALPVNGRVTNGVLPAGRYASLVYVGNGYTGNKTLVEWAKANGIAWDRWDDAKGDAFRSRYETYLTDPAIEPRKTKWEVEVAIKLADE
ncbi:MAG: GyrI-like domain-containing protein [Chloroflexi bacterium]|nr:GyrI-like domain-containing protein [Chloroflexota bacterium]MBP8058435.1 GyrI-like domain-containing protein [Chloroflexota bacterium]